MIRFQFLLLLVTTCFLLSGCSDTDTPKEHVAKQRASISNLAIYQVDGADDHGMYTGKVILQINNSKPTKADAIRIIYYLNGATHQSTGSGKISHDAINFQFNSSIVVKSTSKNLVRKRLPKESQPAISTFISGQFVNTDSAKVRVVSRIGEKIFKTKETWTLKEKLQSNPAISQRTKVNINKWNAIELKTTGPGLLKVSIPDAGTPLGIFLPKGKKPPTLKTNPNDDRPLPFFGGPNQLGLPQLQTAFDGAIWTKKLTEKEASTDWVFWWRDDTFQEARYIDFKIETLPSDWFKYFCDPWVKINISPSVVAAGEPIDINVQARAWAGLNMYWWFGMTGISEFDKAFIKSGGGLVNGNHNWTIQINEPGNYTFGTNARDILYPEAGVAHQASEGCGLAYDTVEVRDQSSRTYSVAFIVLAPVGTDTSSNQFQTLLARVNGIKAQLPNQFSNSTDGRGIVDISYPTVVLTPPGPVYGLTDPANMWSFISDTLNNEFYMHHPDDFDFVAIYETYPDVSIGSRHLTTRTRVAGFGITPYDNSSSWGSAGRLRGIGLITDVNNLPDTYDFLDSRMHLLLHEVFGHQWGVRANRLTSGGAHFDIGIQSPNFSVLYGRPWIKVDDTNYTTANIIDPATGTHKVIFHPWMLYVAGMKQYHEVPSSILDVEPDTPPSSRYDIVTTTGTSETVTLDSVIMESGDRYDVP